MEKTDFEWQIARGLHDALKKTQPTIYQIVVDLVNRGQTKNQIMYHVNRVVVNAPLTKGCIESTIDVLLKERREAINAN